MKIGDIVSNNFTDHIGVIEEIRKNGRHIKVRYEERVTIMHDIYDSVWWFPPRNLTLYTPFNIKKNIKPHSI